MHSDTAPFERSIQLGGEYLADGHSCRDHENIPTQWEALAYYT
jgi:hypothetical protein